MYLHGAIEKLEEDEEEKCLMRRRKWLWKWPAAGQPIPPDMD